MGISQEQSDRIEADAESWQRFFHDLVVINSPGAKCPCRECQFKRSLPMNQKQPGGS